MFADKGLTVAAIFAHPDDEVLAAGASLARHARAGHTVGTLIAAAGLDSRGAGDALAHDRLKADADAAAAALGIAPPHLAGLPDNQLDSIPLLRLTQTIEAFLDTLRPQIIYTHHRGDLNIDHRLIHDAVLTAARPLPGSTVRCILAGEVLSSTEWQSPHMAPFLPTRWHDAEATLEAKIAAMASYAGEARPFPHPRSPQAIDALARFRGAQCGRMAAEAFIVLREIV